MRTYRRYNQSTDLWEEGLVNETKIVSPSELDEEFKKKATEQAFDNEMAKLKGPDGMIEASWEAIRLRREKELAKRYPPLPTEEQLRVWAESFKDDND